MDYLDGFIYHMTSFENLRDIFRRKALLSKGKLDQEKWEIHSIANDEVQSLRARVYVWHFSKQKYRPLHSYVPFYFATRTPMLYNKYKEGIQDKIVIFEVSRSVLKDQGVLFSDGNASIQRLAWYGTERVFITPATVSSLSCQRKYVPDGPSGTSMSSSELYADVAFLEFLDWDGINNKRFIEELA